LNTMPLLKTYTVFNVAQIEGLPEHFYAKPTNPPPLAERIAHAGAFVTDTGADIHHGDNMAYYAPSRDMRFTFGQELRGRTEQETKRDDDREQKSDNQCGLLRQHSPFNVYSLLSTACSSVRIGLTSPLSRELAEKITTLRAAIMTCSPVCGFLPGRGFLLFTVNVPKLEMPMGSPCCRVVLRSAKNQSSSVAASFFEIPAS
jgi:hypothetical protein